MQKNFIIAADLHIEDYGGYRLIECLSALEDLFKLAGAYNADILFAGDLVDKAAALKSHVLVALNTMLAKCFYMYPDIYFFAISGNHDMTTRYADASSVIKMLSDIYPQFVNLDERKFVSQVFNFALHGIPFCDKREDFLSKLAQVGIVKGKTNILLTHQCDPATPFSDIYAKDVEAFDFCFNGHIHRYKQHTENFYTVGNPLWRNNSDNGDEKGVLLFREGKVERIFLNYPTYELVVSDKKAQGREIYTPPTILKPAELVVEYGKYEKLSEKEIQIGLDYL